jgi:quinol monooxygenase YgiN
MAANDTCCTLVPYFKVAPGKLAEFKALGDIFVAKTRTEPGCVHYAFSFNGDEAHCREGYDNAAALLAHLENVGAPLQEALKIAQITRLEVHAPASGARSFSISLAGLNPQWFTVEIGFRR